MVSLKPPTPSVGSLVTAAAGDSYSLIPVTPSLFPGSGPWESDAWERAGGAPTRARRPQRLLCQQRAQGETGSPEGARGGGCKGSGSTWRRLKFGSHLLCQCEENKRPENRMNNGDSLPLMCDDGLIIFLTGESRFLTAGANEFSTVLRSDWPRTGRKLENLIKPGACEINGVGRLFACR